MVSAIITTHNRPRAILKRAIESVRNQSYADIEIIIVDDSTSDFEERNNIINMIYKDYPEVKVIIHSECQGACASRNDGILLARGEYVAFLDDDDEWLPHKIEKQVEVLKNNRLAALVYCDYYIINNTGECIIHESSAPRENILQELLLDNIVGGTSFPLIRKKQLIDVGMFDTEMPQAQDYDVWLRLARKYEFVYLNEPLVNYYIHSGEQITKNINRIVVGQERIILKNIDLLKSNKYLYWKRLVGMPPLYARNKEPIKACKCILKVISLQPFKIKENVLCVARTIKMLSNK